MLAVSPLPSLKGVEVEAGGPAAVRSKGSGSITRGLA
jgi:hypothetical protein